LNSELVRQVWQRAGSRCEYCHLPSIHHPAPFQIDHIIAQKHGGLTSLDNLALACIHCNRFKGPNIAGIDAESGEIVRLFRPRRDDWNEHFFWDGARLEGRTRIGRVTIGLLLINDSEMLAVRQALRDEGIPVD
jgi:hypothetical protein